MRCHKFQIIPLTDHNKIHHRTEYRTHKKRNIKSHKTNTCKKLKKKWRKNYILLKILVFVSFSSFYRPFFFFKIYKKVSNIFTHKTLTRHLQDEPQISTENYACHIDFFFLFLLFFSVFFSYSYSNSWHTGELGR